MDKRPKKLEVQGEKNEVQENEIQKVNYPFLMLSASL